MKKGGDGFILFMTLCTVCVISVLLIASMQHVLLLHKAINQQELAHQNFYQLEDLAKQLANAPSLAIKKNCIQYGADSANQVLQQLKENEGCLLLIGQTSYRYIIEDLGDFPCLVFYRNSQKFASHHTRISIMSVADNKNQASALQLRFIKPSTPVKCLEVERKIKSGISSWRYIPVL